MLAARTTRIALIAAAAVGLLLWIVLGPTPGPTPGPTEVRGANGAADEREDGTPALAIDARDASSTRDPLAPGRVESGGSSSVITNASERIVQLVEHGTGAPVTAAETRFAAIDPVHLDDLVPWTGEVTALVEFLDREGAQLDLDDRGAVRLPAVTGTAALVARSGPLFGVLVVEADASGPLTLELRRDRTLDIEVVDTSERPIPELALLLTTQGRGSQPTLRLVTDANGCATLDHADWILGARAAETFSIEPRALLRDAVRVERAATVLDEPLRVVLPEVGRVVVGFTTVLGEPWPKGSPHPRLDLMWAGGGGMWAEDGGPASDREQRALRLRADPGDEPWAWVEVGPRVVAACRPASSADFVVHDESAGPRAAFDEVRVDLVLGADHPLLRVRAVDTSGRPLAERELSVRTHDYDGFGSSRGRRWIGRSDADGAILVPLDRPRTGYRLRARISAAGHGSEHALEAVVDVPRDASTGVVDAGDVVLERAPLLVSGVVLDARDEPVAGARVAAQLSWPSTLLPVVPNELADVDPTDEVAFARARSRQEHRERVRASMRFGLAPGVECTSDANGRFEIRSPEPVDGLRLTARRPDGPEGTPLEVEPGTEVVLRVLDPTRVVGRVLLPPGLEPDALSMALTEAGSHSYHYRQLILDEHGEWSVDGVAPGTWVLRIADSTAFGWEPLSQVDGIEVVAGRTTRVPVVDLRSLLHVIDLEVVDEHGAPIDAARGTFHGVDSGENNDIAVVDGRARILTRHREIVAWLGAPGRRAIRVDRPKSGERVVLPRAIEVEVQLEDLAALPLAPLELVAYLQPGGGQTNWVLGTIRTGEQAVFDPTGRAVLGAAVAREQSIVIGVRDPRRRRSNGSVPIHWLEGGAWSTIEVTEDPLEAPFVLTVDPQRVRAAAERLGGGE